MTRIWVGSIVTGVILLAALVPAGGAPNESLYRNDFFDGDGNFWTLVSGNISLVNQNGWAGDLLSWLVLEDNDDYDGTGPSQVRADDPAVNTTLASYAIHAVMERDPTYVAPGTTIPDPSFIAISFGDNGNGYYRAAFRTFDNGTDAFLLSVPNATSGGSDLVHQQYGWGDVPAWISDVDKRHKYSLEIDGTTITVKVDGWQLGQFVLPGTAAGTFGLVAGDNTRVYIEQMFYEPLDKVAPTIEIWRPSDGNVYVADEPVAVPATGLVVAAGELTVGADVTDAVSGTKSAYLYIDGALQAGSHRADPGIGTEWTIDTLGLSIGEHTLTVRAYDYAGNYADESVSLLIVGANADGRTTKLVVDTATGLL